MAHEKYDLEEYKRLLVGIEEALEKGPWKETRFLMAIGKKLLEIREKLLSTIAYHEALQASREGRNGAYLTGVDPENQIEVFISLYNSNGLDLEAWRKQVLNIRQLVISRPIYLEEKDVRSWIRSRIDETKEGYAGIMLNKADIIPPVPGRATRDPFDKELIQTKGSLSTFPIITVFCHKSGVYELKNGNLIRLGDYQSRDK